MSRRCVWRRPVAMIAAVGVIVAGCSGGGDAASVDSTRAPAPIESAPDQPVGDEPVGDESVVVGDPLVTLANADGSAFPGSRTAFLVTNTGTGLTTTVSVLGDVDGASTTFSLPAGPYEIQPASALQVLACMLKLGKPMSELAKSMQDFPQILENVHVKEKRPFDEVPEAFQQELARFIGRPR